MIAPKIALPIADREAGEAAADPGELRRAAASIRSAPVPVVVVVVEPVPVVTVVVVPPSSRAAIAPAMVPILGVMLE